MSFYKKSRDDTSIIQTTIIQPRINALYSEHLGKYVVSLQTFITSRSLKKKLGFRKPEFFSIIVDIEEEVFLNVFNQKITKVWLCCDSCDLVDTGNSFSMFWRNQTEPIRELRIYTESGDMLRFTSKGYFVRAAANENEKERV